MRQLIIHHGDRIQFNYTGRDGQTNLKEGIFKGVDYGDFGGYSEPQWLLRLWINQNIGDRSFAIKGIDEKSIVNTTFPERNINANSK